MKVLILKTSSMGDIIHTFPALTDAKKALGLVHFDWVVEENYIPLLKMHPLVKEIIPISLRRWRKNIFKLAHWKEIRDLFRQLRKKKYDLIIDAQGLVKSAVLTLPIAVKSVGYDRFSIKQPLAAWFYDHKVSIKWEEHAVKRIRYLFSQALGYSLPEEAPTFGLKSSTVSKTAEKYIVLFHGTTWETKHWPEVYWSQLILLITNAGYQIKLAWGNSEEKQRSLRLQQNLPAVKILPPLDIEGMAQIISGSVGVVAVDTGFAHLAEALDIPTVTLFGPTDAKHSGPQGIKQKGLNAEFPCAPCFKDQCYYRGESKVKPACFEGLEPLKVWTELKNLIKKE